jgi:RNA polymerase sigma factor (sigma-70 family)
VVTPVLRARSSEGAFPSSPASYAEQARRQLSEQLRPCDADFADFFAVLLPQAVSVARRITGDLASAEDAAAEALARAYVRWAKLHAVSHREAWVLRVTTNEAIGAVRKRSRRAQILVGLGRAELPSDPCADPATTLLAHSIDRLPRRQRDVVSLRYFAQLSTDEVAATLGISSGSVKTHLHRAVHTLRHTHTDLGPLRAHPPPSGADSTAQTRRRSGGAERRCGRGGRNAAGVALRIAEDPPG